MAFARPATDPSHFGITRDHWREVARLARLKEYVIALRTGKKSAVNRDGAAPVPPMGAVW